MIGAGPLADAATVLVTDVGAAEGARAAAAALACAGAEVDRATLLIDFDGRPPRPTLLTSAAAGKLEERLAAHLPSLRVAARGSLCQVAVPADADGLEAALAAVTVARGALAALHVPPTRVQPLLDEGLAARLSAALLRADLETDRALLALVVRDLCDRGLAIAVLKQRLAWVSERRALFGALAPGSSGGLPDALVRRLSGSVLSTGRATGTEVGTAEVAVRAGAGAGAAS